MTRRASRSPSRTQSSQPAAGTINPDTIGEDAEGNSGRVRKIFGIVPEILQSARNCRAVSSGGAILERIQRLYKNRKYLLKALKVFKLFDIPHYVCGGFAVQEHGYPRFTVDVDLIVPDVAFATEKLSLNGFKMSPGSKMTVTDRETKVEVDLLPGGKKVDPGPLTFPMPNHVSEEPQILTLEKPISAKLSTYIGMGVYRAQDYADVAKLIQANRLPRKYGVDPEVQNQYQNIWDELRQPKKTQ